MWKRGGGVVRGDGCGADCFFGDRLIWNEVHDRLDLHRQFFQFLGRGSYFDITNSRIFQYIFWLYFCFITAV